MTDLIDTTEMYLKTVYELEEEGVAPLRARIAERLGHSGPTVSQTVARMERAGLLHLASDRQIELTTAGRDKAVRVMRKHRLAERLLVDVVGLDWALVHEEACRWEHVMSEQVERRLVEILDHPHIDPYGNPIPGLDALGEPVGDAVLAPGGTAVTGLRALSEVVEEIAAGPASREARAIVLHRIGEPLQVDVELLERMADAGLKPGSQLELRVFASGDVVTLHAPGADMELEVPDEVSRHLFVARP
ncbi:metal-dependent transcriptional regulator [Bogoriella caseilytica]|uniref:DtxR family iron (Metal) dependent repressor n=1 Tax=Bogoriella caseilytica TaxID=56055 RepID=A0A3N2BDS3_9MICO|nr:metal-dependent transcriptional regulator [Bogoriella caseilytica]ROR73392.1 DtxR family iron (metal) dependent repressor [Bogoriella caseilytica]